MEKARCWQNWPNLEREKSSQLFGTVLIGLIVTWRSFLRTCPLA
jgi:hypothetical protein